MHRIDLLQPDTGAFDEPHHHDHPAPHHADHRRQPRPWPRLGLALAAQGHDLILTYRTRRDEADRVAAEVAGLGGRAALLALDAGDSGGFGPFAQAVQEQLGAVWGRSHFDNLVHNAGMGVHAGFVETTESQFDELMRVHLKGPFFLTQALLPMLADGGSILHVSSGLARFSFPASPPTRR